MPAPSSLSYPWQVRQAAAAALQACAALYQSDPTTYARFAPLVGSDVKLSAVWPVQAGQATKIKQTILVYTLNEDGQGLARAGTQPEFSSTLTLALELRLEETNSDQLDATLDSLVWAVRHALLQTVAFTRLAERFNRLTLEQAYNGEGKRMLGQARLAVELVYTDVYEPIVTDLYTGMNIYVDAVNVYDPSGTYTPPFPYTPTAAPRTAGPDGRVEIAGSVDAV